MHRVRERLTGTVPVNGYFFCYNYQKSGVKRNRRTHKNHRGNKASQGDRFAKEQNKETVPPFSQIQNF